MSRSTIYRSTYSSQWQPEAPPPTSLLPSVSSHDSKARVFEFLTTVPECVATVSQEPDVAESYITLLIAKLDPEEPYRILTPIHVKVYFQDDDTWMAVFEDAAIAFSASDPESARNELAKEILDIFEDFKELEALGDLDDRSARRLATLRRHILHK